jgi:bifunctional non-homologous end joining protein LigD
MLRSRPSGFIEPCLPSLADRPPSGSKWIHEIKHDGFPLLACRDAAGVRLLTWNANDFAARYPLIVEVQSCVIDGEAVACDRDGLSIFEKLRYSFGRSTCWRSTARTCAACRSRSARLRSPGY